MSLIDGFSRKIRRGGDVVKILKRNETKQNPKPKGKKVRMIDYMKKWFNILDS